ncbi:MAG: preprotein translocase subunit SecA [Bacteroidales bacterium]|jgi:preprotein translocase subunit SecA|nr:preprotein translocase subunit SecA [Bacteroidales bacterium]MCK9498588.1 preprotein translocase subunit SecA [Bacteroidales bacterium]MDY0314713.1 preprotein translocase subunit SecA [Bacteroidales bacterium]NLB85495.1 preprotein translocase subunit SecA [Bacteroidales bacterium]
MGLNSLIAKIFGSKAERDLKAVQPFLEKVLAVEPEITKASNDELRERSTNLRKRIAEHIKPEQDKIIELKAKAEALDIWQREEIFNEIDKIEEKIDKDLEVFLNELLPEAFAIVKETARRFKENKEVVVTVSEFDKNLATNNDFVEIKGDKAVWFNSWVAGGNTVTWDMVHYDVQIIGGVVLHSGKIAEMATGEGKTLVATLPVFLNALTGRGVHVVTVNDYLAKRDSEWMGPIYMFHGLSVDCIDKHEPNSEARRNAYMADITFGTNNEFGFDYLRDNMALNPSDLVQRKHNYAIVDEVDSVLIDDARTPLIISGPTPKGEDQLFDELKPQVQKLVNAQRNLFNDIFTEAKKLIAAENEKDGGFKLLQAFKALPRHKPLIKFLSEQGMKTLLQKTENHYMADNNKQMHLVTDDLYFVIDEKLNSIEPTDKGFDLLANSSSDTNFFVLPDIATALSDLEKSSMTENERLNKKDEIIRDFSVKSERIHTVNQLLKAYTLFEKDVEYVVMDNKVKIVDEQTGRIMEGRRYSDGLHQAIEAKENVKIEAATQTYATITLQNYFRMYHKLSGMTGTAETEAGELWDIYKLDVVVIPTNRPIVRYDREDLVYKTNREKYGAVIDEIESLTKEGRPVLVGTTSVEISELLSKILSRKGIKHNVLNAKLHKREADIVAEAGYSSNVTIATNMAGRGTDIKLSDKVKDAGGLAIVGTERHESRRVDRQLRGRAGRQGDPGSSQFFVSLEDDLMRLFGSDRIAKMMDRMGLKEGEVIQHSMISKSIERAQKKVEENNFGIRKRLLEYDDVMNSQRTVIYKKRKNALDGERLGADIANMMYDVCVSLVDEYFDNLDFEDIKLELFRTLSIELDINENEYKDFKYENFIEYIYEKARENHKRKTQAIADQAYPIIKTIFEAKQSTYDNILVPISDGFKEYSVIVNLEKTYNNKGEEIVAAYDKTIVLKTIDEYWKEHLREMDDLRQSVQSASYEQKDPLLIYKLESFELFKTMLDKINKSVVFSLMRGFIPVKEADEVREARVRSKLDLSKMKTGREDPGYHDPSKGKSVAEPVRVEKKVGRNDPCPCGSGKKFKHCHGINAE